MFKGAVFIIELLFGLVSSIELASWRAMIKVTKGGLDVLMVNSYLIDR